MRWATRTDEVPEDATPFDGPLYDGLYEYLKRSAVSGRDPA